MENQKRVFWMRVGEPNPIEPPKDGIHGCFFPNYLVVITAENEIRLNLMFETNVVCSAHNGVELNSWVQRVKEHNSMRATLNSGSFQMPWLNTYINSFREKCVAAIAFQQHTPLLKDYVVLHSAPYSRQDDVFQLIGGDTMRFIVPGKRHGAGLLISGRFAGIVLWWDEGGKMTMEEFGPENLRPGAFDIVK